MLCKSSDLKSNPNVTNPQGGVKIGTKNNKYRCSVCNKIDYEVIQKNNEPGSLQIINRIIQLIIFSSHLSAGAIYYIKRVLLLTFRSTTNGQITIFLKNDTMRLKSLTLSEEQIKAIIIILRGVGWQWELSFFWACLLTLFFIPHYRPRPSPYLIRHFFHCLCHIIHFPLKNNKLTIKKVLS